MNINVDCVHALTLFDLRVTELKGPGVRIGGGAWPRLSVKPPLSLVNTVLQSLRGTCHVASCACCSPFIAEK